MTDTPSTLSQFNALTLEGIAILEQLKSQLDIELKALSEKDLDKVRNINTEKHTTLAEFDKNNHLRGNCLTSAGFEVNKENIQALVEHSKESALKTEFQQNWKQLEKTLNEAMDRNKRNEIVLTRNRQNVEQLLTVLRGQPAKHTLYDSKGGKGNYSGQSRLGKA